MATTTTSSSTSKIYYAILGEGDTFDTAQYGVLDISSSYAPFVKVTSNGTDPIKSFCLFKDAEWDSAPNFGFFDVYATPEPVSLVLMSVGLLGVIRRRRAA